MLRPDLIVLIAAGALVVGACSGDSGDTDTAATSDVIAPTGVEELVAAALTDEVGLSTEESTCVTAAVISSLGSSDGLPGDPATAAEELVAGIDGLIDDCVSEERQDELEAELDVPAPNADRDAFVLALGRVDPGLADEPEGALRAAASICALAEDIGLRSTDLAVALASQGELAADLIEMIEDETGVVLDVPTVIAFSSLAIAAFCGDSGS